MQVLNYQSPIGNLKLVEDGDYLREIRFEEDTNGNGTGHSVLAKASRQLTEYFEGNRTEFDLPLRPEGTEFQQKVWQMLATIPYGTTISYMDLAKKLGDQKAIRAAGRANGQNPIPIVVPCHRVIGTDGNLIGYGGGIERKRWLLQHEGALLL